MGVISFTVSKNLETINALVSISKYKEALEEIEVLEDTINVLEKEYSKLMIIKSGILTKLGFFEKSVKLVKKILSNSEKSLLDLEDKCDLYCTMIESLWQQGQFEESLSFIEKAQNLSKEARLEEKSSILNEINSKLLFHLSSVYGFIDLRKALKYINESLLLSKMNKDNLLYAQGLYRKSKIFTYQGNLQESLKLLEQTLEMGKKLSNNSIIADTYVAVGEIYRLKGDFGKALELYNKALILHQEFGNIYGMAVTYNNIGIVFFSKGDFANSLEYFTKSLERAMEINFKFTIVESAFYLINILLNKDQIKEAENHLKLSKLTSEEFTGTMIHYYSLLSEAIVLKKFNRFNTLGEAQTILENIIEKNLVYQEINIHAMLNLCEILLIELRFTNNPIILADLEKLTDKLLTIAEQQISRSLLAEVFWLKGRLALVDANLEKARTFLFRAQSTAEGQDLENLARKISNDHDNLLNEIEKWKTLIEEDASLTDRIKESKIDTLVLNMINRATFELEEIENDIPVMMILLNEHGIPMFSIQFGEGTMVDQVLLSGFLSAINNIVQEVFSTEGSIKRIEHQNYLLIFQNIQNIIICYAFKGSSYSARKKVEKFVAKLNNSDLLEELVSAIKRGRLIEDEKELILQTWAKEIFETID